MAELLRLSTARRIVCGLAWGCRENCGRSCEGLNQNSPAPYGAIAFGARGAKGISWNQGSWAMADRWAIANCSRYGSDCKAGLRSRANGGPRATRPRANSPTPAFV